MFGLPTVVLIPEFLLRWIGALTLAFNQSRTKVNAEPVGLSLLLVPLSFNAARNMAKLCLSAYNNWLTVTLMIAVAAVGGTTMLGDISNPMDRIALSIMTTQAL